MTPDGRQDRSDARQGRNEDRGEARDHRMDRSDARSDAGDDRSDRADLRMDLADERMSVMDHRGDISDDRQSFSENLARKRHKADLSQRVVVVITIAVVMIIISLMAVTLFHVVKLEKQNLSLNNQLIEQQTLLQKVSGEIAAATLYAVACAEPDGPETIEEIQRCVEQRTMDAAE